MQCTTCHDTLVSENNFTQFSCPSCMKHEIVRCENCRRKSNIYRCTCGFEGP
ncbi:MAG: RNA-binding protein [Candidatus Aenigmarchaeota archaeon]|nr:RNA-binding protein [Candidatus Aenigmarchaeota archaeon]